MIRHGTVGTGALGRPDDLSCGHNEIVLGTLSRSWGRGQVEGGNWEESREGKLQLECIE